jgi:hypothetical protein
MLAPQPQTLSNGPYYCPAGTTWADLYKMAHELREAGNSVIVRKYPVGNIPVLAGNTHRVFLEVRVKA